MTRAAAARRVALTLALGLVGPLAAEASTSRDTSFKPASFAAAPQLVTPSLVEELRAIEAKASKAAECVALCDIAAAVEAHPFGVPSAETPRRSEDAWGNYRFTSELETSHNRFGFTGHYWDKEASLYYAKARYYDPFTARFTQADSFPGTIDDPPSLHRYFYAADNPTFFADPTGHAAIDYITDGAKSVYGFGKGVAKSGYEFGAGIVKLGVKAAEVDYKLKFGSFDQKREALGDLGSIVTGAGSHLVESGQLLYHGVTNPGDVVAAAAQLGPEGIGEAIGGASFDTALLVAPAAKGVAIVEGQSAMAAGASSAAAEQAVLRARVLANINASKAARESSRFAEYANSPTVLAAERNAAQRASIEAVVRVSEYERAMAKAAGGWDRYLAAEERAARDSATGRGYGVNDPPVRIEAPWSLNDMKQALLGHSPRGLGSPDLHHAHQMPGSGIHEVLDWQHRGNPALHPNKFNQGVTREMRESDRRLHWWYRAREQGADQLLPDWIYDNVGGSGGH